MSSGTLRKHRAHPLSDIHWESSNNTHVIKPQNTYRLPHRTDHSLRTHRTRETLKHTQTHDWDALHDNIYIHIDFFRRWRDRRHDWPELLPALWVQEYLWTPNLRLDPETQTNMHLITIFSGWLKGRLVILTVWSVSWVWELVKHPWILNILESF